MIGAMGNERQPDHPKYRAFKQKKRCVQCAVNLAARLQTFIDLDNEDEFRRQCRADAAELAATPFGVRNLLDRCSDCL